FGIPKAFGSGETLARAPEVDLVIVSSTPDAHARHAIAALEAEKHVLCEKPMALTVREAEEMLEVAERSRGLARIDHELRYEPNRRKVRHLIQVGAIGPVLHLELVLRPYVRGAVASITLTTVASHGPGHFAQITGRDGTLVLTGETSLEIGRPGGPLEDASVPDDLWEQTAPNNMWARSFVRLMRDMVAVLEGRPAAGEPATFYDGLAVQRVMEAVRDGGRVAAAAG